MTETAEELAAEHTRRELEGMAEKLGIETLGIGTKTRLAEAIIKAKEKAGAKKIPKPKMEAPVKMQTKPRIGKKGVLSKRAAIDDKAKEMQKGVREMHKGIEAQIKENEEAVAKMDLGVKELQNAMDNKAKDLQKGVREMHKGIGAQIKENEEAAAKMDLGVKELQNDIKEFQDETANYIKDFYYG